ncbi:MAG: hypothetical protein ACRD9Y_26690, partial [Blastocatellia bacterium]
MKSSPGKFRLFWRRWRWYFVAGYAALLLVSHAARWLYPADEAPMECCAAHVRAVDGDHYLDQRARIAYRDYPAKND